MKQLSPTCVAVMLAAIGAIQLTPGPTPRRQRRHPEPFNKTEKGRARRKERRNKLRIRELNLAT
jgi:hypothetical protein